MSEKPSKEQILKTFGRDASNFIDTAAALGWRVLFNSTGTSITLIPHDDGPKRIHLSSKNKNSGALKKHVKTLVRFADPVALQATDDLINASMPDDAKAMLFEIQSKLRAEDFEVMPDPEPEVRRKRTAPFITDKPPAKKTPAKKTTTRKTATKKAVAKPQEATAVPASAIPTPKQVAERVVQERQILSERPAMMHYSLTQSGGRSYPSKTTLERLWSDGTIDYACTVSTCDMTSENRRAFGGAHWAMHVRRGEAEPYDEEEAKRTVVDDPSYTEHAWSRKQNLRDKRTRELTHLLEGLDLKKITAEDLAEQILDFLGDHGRSGGTRSIEPLTDAQVLDRIRTLVDRGTYADQEKAIFERDRQIEDLMQYSEQREGELAQKLLEAEQRATKAEATMNAFYDLVHELKPGEAN